jgi:hypothetical protein
VSRAHRALLIGVMALATVVVPETRAAAVVGALQPPAGGLTHLMRFVPAPSSVQELAGLWVHYADPGTVNRIHGMEAAVAAGDAPLAFVPDDATDLTPEQERIRLWQRDWTAFTMAAVSGVRNVTRWRTVFGYDRLDVERSLEYGQPVKDVGILELRSDTSAIAERLLALGYQSEPAPAGFGGTLCHRFRDDEISPRSDEAASIALSTMNRVVLGPSRVVAARSTEMVSMPLAASMGQVPSAMSVSPIALVVESLDDPALLPGTTLVGASLVGFSLVPSSISGSSPEEAIAERAALPSLPPYLLFGLGYRRGVDQAERFQIITLLYPDAGVAQAAGTSLTTRIARFKGRRDGEPLVGSEVVEQLEPVVRASDQGATVTVRLRLAPDQPNRFRARLYNRELEFMVPSP